MDAKILADARAAAPGAILLFKMGDFWEAFDEDARTIGRTLGLALTSRDKTDAIRMAGFPYHQLDAYVAKLVASGYRVALCERGGVR